jgi:predicted 2-oxoglutarate/Fe(II)-dependent dioxygenase YbiX
MEFEINTELNIGKPLWKFFLKKTNNPKINHYMNNGYFLFETENNVVALIDHNNEFYLEEKIYDEVLTFFCLSNDELYFNFKSIIKDKMNVEISKITIL